MTARLRQFMLLVAAALLAGSVGGCASLNEKAAAALGDYVPEWAGGLPPDAPPRPGTAKYDAWMKERERERLLPADHRDKANAAATTASGQSAPASNSSTASTPPSGIAPVR